MLFSLIVLHLFYHTSRFQRNKNFSHSRLRMYHYVNISQHLTFLKLGFASDKKKYIIIMLKNTFKCLLNVYSNDIISIEYVKIDNFRDRHDYADFVAAVFFH